MQAALETQRREQLIYSRGAREDFTELGAQVESCMMTLPERQRKRSREQGMLQVETIAQAKHSGLHQHEASILRMANSLGDRSSGRKRAGAPCGEVRKGAPFIADSQAPLTVSGSQRVEPRIPPPG